MDWEGFLLPNMWLSSFCLAAFLFLFFLQVICSQLSSSRSLVWCADGEASSSQPVAWCAALISPLSQTLTPFAFFCLTTIFPPPNFLFLLKKKKKKSPFRCISRGFPLLPSGNLCLSVCQGQDISWAGEHMFLQLLPEPRIHILGGEAAVCLPLCVYSWATTLIGPLWELR